VDRLLKQTKKFLFHKIIPRAGSNHAPGRMFDTPVLAAYTIGIIQADSSGILKIF